MLNIYARKCAEFLISNKLFSKDLVSTHLQKPGFHIRRATSGGKRKGLPSLFLKIQKKCSDFAKRYLHFSVHLKLNSHLKCSFKSMLDKKHQNFYTYEVFLLYVVLEYMEYLSN